MFGTRGFMDGAPMLGRPVFQSLGNQARMSQSASVTPTPPPVVAASQAGKKIGTALIGLGVGFLALEVVGATNFTGVRKFVGG